MQDSILRQKNIYFYRRKMQILCEAHKEINNRHQGNRWMAASPVHRSADLGLPRAGHPGPGTGSGSRGSLGTVGCAVNDLPRIPGTATDRSRSSETGREGSRVLEQTRREPARSAASVPADGAFAVGLQKAFPPVRGEWQRGPGSSSPGPGGHPDCSAGGIGGKGIAAFRWL